MAVTTFEGKLTSLRAQPLVTNPVDENSVAFGLDRHGGRQFGFDLTDEHTQAMLDLLQDAFDGNRFVSITNEEFDIGDAVISVRLVANRPPAASFTRTPDAGAAPLEVGFDGSASSDPDGTVTAHDWNFGDGATSTGETVVHTYANPGRYFATLTVTDDNGARNSTGQIVTVG